MPYSFTQIEEDKTKTIAVVFCFLIFFYFVSSWFLYFFLKNFFIFQNYLYNVRHGYHVPDFSFTGLGPRETGTVILVSLVIGCGHWLYSMSDNLNKILSVLKAEPLNKNDRYHQVFQNVIEEVMVATGGKKKIEGVVIPTMAMNAFALADFKGRSVIGVTEGLLARATRSQLEAVVGHEAAHILAGDCLSTTVASSIFQIYTGILQGLESMESGSSSRRGRGADFFLVIVYLVVAFMRFLSSLISMFISREREYRADAIAVRLTRDPLSLAEALYLISYRWRGQSLPAQELEAIFIINPEHRAIDESEGTLADLFSTHPPIKNRLQILLDMAHVDFETLSKDVVRKSEKPKVSVSAVSATVNQWVVQKDGAWQGPFDLIQMAQLGWLGHESWVQRLGEGQVKMAYEEKDIAGIFGRGTAVSAECCPKCGIPLQKIDYEGTEVLQCGFCQGVLVGDKDVQRIIIREEVEHSPKIINVAKGIQKEERAWKSSLSVIKKDEKAILGCPKCTQHQRKMIRMFFTEAYRIEIDKCTFCASIWFDKNELEVLQYLIEQRVAKAS